MEIDAAVPSSRMASPPRCHAPALLTSTPHFPGRSGMFVGALAMAASARRARRPAVPLGRATQRRRARPHARASRRRSADGFADDFNRELTRAFFWLQVGRSCRATAVAPPTSSASSTGSRRHRGPTSCARSIRSISASAARSRCASSIATRRASRRRLAGGARAGAHAPRRAGRRERRRGSRCGCRRSGPRFRRWRCRACASTHADRA